MSASMLAPDALSILDLGNAPEVFASGLEICAEADHWRLRWYRTKTDADSLGRKSRFLVAEIILTADALARIQRQMLSIAVTADTDPARLHC